MDINQFIETYGRDPFKEILDLAIISDLSNVPYAFWYGFCLRHNIIKRTTKTVKPTYVSSWKGYHVGVPIQCYEVTLKNGSGKQLFRLYFTERDIESYREK